MRPPRLSSLHHGSVCRSAATSLPREAIEQEIKESGAEVAVAVRTLDVGRELLIGPDIVFHAASTMKVPVMIELFRQAEAGRIPLHTRIPIVNTFSSIVDGSPYTLWEGDDSDVEVYRNIGRTMTARELCELMITVSSTWPRTF